MSQETWLLLCSCCCGTQQDFTQHPEYPTNLQCPTCGCRKNKPKPPAIKIRVYIQGTPTLGQVERLQEVARLMGASDDATIVRDSDEQHYVELPGEGITTRLEIAEITGTRQKREKAKP